MADKQDKAEKFHDGLIPLLHERIAPLMIETYADVVRRACVIESSIQKDVVELPMQQREWVGQKGCGSGSGQKQSEKLKASHPPPPRCGTCGKSHFAQCKAGQQRCYGCGSMDHRVRKCPPKSSQPAPPPHQPQHPRPPPPQ